MSMIHSFHNRSAVELTSADMQGAILAIRSQNIEIEDVEQIDALTLRFSVENTSMEKLQMLSEKRGDQLKLLSQNGWRVLQKRWKERPVLVVGLLLLLLFFFWVPGKVLFVQVEGNQKIPTRYIVEKASECGLTFGTSRRQVRSEKVKNGLLEAIPELSWAGINTFGCTAVISVKEQLTSVERENEGFVSSIVASRDGYVLGLNVLQGNAVCKVGQAVKQGQVLISGYTDCGISILATNAKGEVYAETKRQISAICPTDKKVRSVETARKQKISLIIGKKRINFQNSSGILDAGCAKIYKEKYVTLPGGFVLPVAISIETSTFYQTEDVRDQSSKDDLTDYVTAYLLWHMCAGEILQNKLDFIESDGCLLLLGEYSCSEMIGVTRIEENIPDYVKNN